MRSTFRIKTVLSSWFAWFAACSLVLISSGCCGGEEWTTQEFAHAGIQFEVPSLWNIEVRVAGEEPVGPEGAKKHVPALGTGAVLTALPVLEDAAVVVIAPQAHVGPATFAGQLKELIPLRNIAFTLQRAPWRMNNLKGIAFEGRGQLPGDHTEVYFRSVLLDVQNKAVIFTLFAEVSERAYYEGIFDRILSSLKWSETTAQPIAPDPTPPPARSPDREAPSSTTASPAPEVLPRVPARPATSLTSSATTPSEQPKPEPDSNSPTSPSATTSSSTTSSATTSSTTASSPTEPALDAAPAPAPSGTSASVTSVPKTERSSPDTNTSPDQPVAPAQGSTSEGSKEASTSTPPTSETQTSAVPQP